MVATVFELVIGLLAIAGAGLLLMRAFDNYMSNRRDLKRSR
jgi:hypothetical protein